MKTVVRRRKYAIIRGKNLRGWIFTKKKRGKTIVFRCAYETSSPKSFGIWNEKFAEAEF